MKLRKAILIIHGFAGGTYDQEVLSNYLELDRHFDVYTFTLPGHDKTILNHVTEQDWINKSEKMIEMLINNGYRKIYVVGHSMGGVIACYLANNHKEVKKLILAAPAFEVITESGNFIDVVKKAPELIKSYKFEELFSRIIKIPFKTTKELKRLVNTYGNTPQNINIPTLIIHGTDDKLVPLDSSYKLLDKLKSKNKKLIVIEGLNHYTFKSIKTDYIIKEIDKFLKKKRYNGTETVIVKK